jgi:hypothetical protein
METMRLATRKKKGMIWNQGSMRPWFLKLWGADSLMESLDFFEAGVG